MNPTAREKRIYKQHSRRVYLLAREMRSEARRASRLAARNAKEFDSCLRPSRLAELTPAPRSTRSRTTRRADARLAGGLFRPMVAHPGYTCVADQIRHHKAKPNYRKIAAVLGLAFV